MFVFVFFVFKETPQKLVVSNRALSDNTVEKVTDWPFIKYHSETEQCSTIMQI